MSLSSCKEDEAPVPIQEIDSDRQIEYSPLEASLFGKVEDLQGTAVAGAKVLLLSRTAGILETTTNDCGLFFFESYENRGDIAHLRVVSDGYFSIQRHVFLMRKTSNYTEILLTPLGEAESFDANRGIAFVSAEGLEADIPEMAFEDGNGMDYSGTVHLHLNQLHHTDPGFSKRIFGGYLAYNDEEQEYFLEVSNYFQLEFRGETGQLLVPKEDSRIEIRISGHLMDEMSSTEPPKFWQYDHSDFVWEYPLVQKMESAARTIRLKSTGLFCFANARDFIGINGNVRISSKLRNYNAPYLKMELIQGNRVIESTFTNDHGDFSFHLVPQEERLKLRISSFCDQVYDEFSFSTGTRDLHLGQFQVIGGTNNFLVKSFLRDDNCSLDYTERVDYQFGATCSRYTGYKTAHFNVVIPACFDEELSINRLDEFGQNSGEIMRLKLNDENQIESIHSSCTELRGELTLFLEEEVLHFENVFFSLRAVGRRNHINILSADFRQGGHEFSWGITFRSTPDLEAGDSTVTGQDIAYTERCERDCKWSFIRAAKNSGDFPIRFESFSWGNGNRVKGTFESHVDLTMIRDNTPYDFPGAYIRGSFDFIKGR